MRNFGALASAATIAFVATMPGVAMAQDNEPVGTTDAETTEANAGVIIVTAQRREQNLQDVPISITAVNGERLSEAGLNDLVDAQQLIPNLRINTGSSGVRPVISIRGVGTSAFNVGLRAKRRRFYRRNFYSKSVSKRQRPYRCGTCGSSSRTTRNSVWQEHNRWRHQRGHKRAGF